MSASPVTIDTLGDSVTFNDIRFTSPNIRIEFLSKILNDKYGLDWLKWEPETIWDTISIDFKTDIDYIVKEKIQALKTLLLVDDYWNEFNIFEAIAKTLNGYKNDFSMLSGLEPAEIAWAVTESNKIRIEEFSDEVKTYISINCRNNGLLVMPEVLSFANPIRPTKLQHKVMLLIPEIRDVKDFDVEENEVGVQLANLNAIKYYIENKKHNSEIVMSKYSITDKD